MMSRMLKPLDDDNEIYPFPNDDDVKELGLNPKCRHGYTNWAYCAACLESMVAHLWTALIEMKVRKRGKAKNKAKRG